ncbi:MAG: transcriptional regulator NrdR [Patescibacteria group bacterium]|jgi:transcriptional repressor NrdR
MRCPVCNFKSTRVVDSRLLSDGQGVRRRRECEKEKCGFRFSTVEEIELLDVTVVKRNGKREAYSREKLINGLKQALQKRPYTDIQLQHLVHAIERDIQKIRGGELTSTEIGEIVMKRLRTFDKVAYIRFASVYRSFEDVGAFAKELKNIS